MFLTGSEKVKDASGSFGGPGMLESNSINKSLLVLGKTAFRKCVTQQLNRNVWHQML